MILYLAIALLFIGQELADSFYFEGKMFNSIFWGVAFIVVLAAIRVVASIHAPNGRTGDEILAAAGALLAIALFHLITKRFQNRAKSNEDNWMLKVKELQLEDQRRLSQAREAELKLQAERNQHMAQIGQITSGLNHEMNNVLAPMQVQFNQLARATSQQPELQKPISGLGGTLDRAKAIVGDLQDFARLQNLTVKQVDLIAVLDIALTQTKSFPSAQGVRFDVKIPTGSAYCEADENRIVRVLVNLLKNAAEATKDKPERKVAVELSPTDAGWRIEVADNGHGISDFAMKKLFEPFFSTKGDDGTGLGLFISRQAIERHGGKIEVRSKPDEGTTFSLTLHRTVPPEAKQPKQES